MRRLRADELNRSILELQVRKDTETATFFDLTLFSTP